jgi:LmbE family N-acetylglucosaminyl deacetylase
MKTLLVSPHLDDAVLSAGQYMADCQDCDVVTVFAGMPKDITRLTPYDEGCGFRNTKDAIDSRKFEDSSALELLDATPIHLGFTDQQYGEQFDFAEVVRALDRVYRLGEYDRVFAPLGGAHPDHIVVSHAVLQLWHKYGFELYLWEDLPARILWPEKIAERLANLDVDTILTPLPAGDLDLKRLAITCYDSQLNKGDLMPEYILLPERFHKVV